MLKNVEKGSLKYETILFDLDGTVMETGEGITKGIAYGLDKCGLPPLPPETLIKFVGPPLRESFKKYCKLDDEGVEEVLKAYREYYSTTGLHECRPYEGIRELLEYLKSRGSRLYVATAKPTSYSEIILNEWDLSRYFIEIVGANLDKSMDDKAKIIRYILENEDAGKTIMVGDSCYDILGAKANNIKSVAVLYGYGNVEDIMKSRPDYTAKTVSDLYKIL